MLEIVNKDQKRTGKQGLIQPRLRKKIIIRAVTKAYDENFTRLFPL